MRARLIRGGASSCDWLSNLAAVRQSNRSFMMERRRESADRHGRAVPACVTTLWARPPEEQGIRGAEHGFGVSQRVRNRPRA
jgi:hypothetical protein